MTENQVESETSKSLVESLTREDVKLFIITVVATVFSNVITVIIIALAIILARSSRPHPGTLGNYAFFFGVTMFTFLGVSGGLWSLIVARTRHGKSDYVEKILKWIIVAVSVVEGIIALIFALTWVGFSAGVK